MSDMSPAAARQNLETLRDASDHDGMLRYLAIIGQSRELDVPELVLKSRALQLAENQAGNLAEARLCLEEALQRDPANVVALLELGWFQFAVEDDASGAAETFKKAAEQATRLLEEAHQGIREAGEEIEAPA